MIDVLLVDDNPDIAESMELLLTLEGYQARTAPDGEAGLCALRDRLPDVVILDVEMPVLDGPGMARRMIVENRGQEKIPIVLASAVAQLSEIAAQVGTPYFLTKPCEPSRLLELLSRAVEERMAPCPPRAVDGPSCRPR